MSDSWIPVIEAESANGTREILLETRLFTQRKLFLTGDINSDTANRFLKEFLYLENESPEPVTIYINSPGGEINAGLVIYDVIQASSLPITMVCTGMAASMAAILLAGGQEGRRLILPHSKVMIHEPLLAGGVGGSASSIRNISDSILETRELVNKILAKHTGKTLREINKATSFDNYMNAEEAVAFGICDAVTEKPFV